MRWLGLASLVAVTVGGCSFSGLDELKGNAGGDKHVDVASDAAQGVSEADGFPNADAGSDAHDAGNEAAQAADAGDAEDQGATVHGVLQFLNTPITETSVILTPKASFDEKAVHLQVPPGPKLGGVSGVWSIPKVPDGSYVVLAGFETDGVVQDPNTPHVEIEVKNGGDVDVGLIKVVGALATLKPNGETVAQSLLEFVWQDQSGADSYALSIVDQAGNSIWEVGYPAPAGDVFYGGPNLISGATYQLRLTASQGVVPISRSEDLAGTFTLE